MGMTGHAAFSCFTQMRSFVCHTTVHIAGTNQNSSPWPVIGMQTENCITHSFQIAESKGRTNKAVISLFQRQLSYPFIPQEHSVIGLH